MNAHQKSFNKIYYKKVIDRHSYAVGHIRHLYTHILKLIIKHFKLLMISCFYKNFICLVDDNFIIFFIRHKIKSLFVMILKQCEYK